MPILFRLVLILIIIYLLGKLFFRYIFPWLLRWWVSAILKKNNPDAYNEMKQARRRRNKKPGDIFIKDAPGKNKTGDNNKNKGEYVDYEEL